jgi:hypothetical protein
MTSFSPLKRIILHTLLCLLTEKRLRFVDDNRKVVSTHFHISLLGELEGVRSILLSFIFLAYDYFFPRLCSSFSHRL